MNSNQSNKKCLTWSSEVQWIHEHSSINKVYSVRDPCYTRFKAHAAYTVTHCQYHSPNPAIKGNKYYTATANNE